MNDHHDERRKNLRIYRNFILSYHEKGKPIIRQAVSQVNNVSRGGLNFSSDRPLNDGTVVTVELKTPFIADAIVLEGVVLQSIEKVPDLIYEIRLQFQEVSAEVLSVLEKIENYSKNQES